MRSTPGGPQWRGWDQTSSGRVGLVTSARLGGDAPVQNRMFPKVRSWFALGAPLELLSPLSVIRIVLIVLIGGAFLLLAAGAVTVAVVAATVLVVLAVLVALTRVKELGARQCVELAVLTTLVVAGLDRGRRRAVDGLLGVLLLVPVAIFVGMFLSWRALLVVQVGGGVAVGAALVAATDAPTTPALLLAVLATVMTTAIAATVALTSSSARGRATVDADTGIPNGYGFAEALGTRVGTGRVVVAVLDLGGLAEAREALGHRAGTELLRRAVEDLGQVLPSGATIGRVDGDRLAATRPLDGPPGADGDNVDVFARQLADGLGAGRYLVDEIEVILRPHLGIAIGPDDGDDATELIRHASLAADRARTTGRVTARWDGSLVGAMTSADLTLLADLRLAPDRAELWMAYQPQIDPATGATLAVEALLRWTSPVHGAVAARSLHPAGRTDGSRRPAHRLGPRRGARRAGAVAARRPRPAGLGQRLGRIPLRSRLPGQGPAPAARPAAPGHVPDGRGHRDRRARRRPGGRPARHAARRAASASRSTTSGPATRRWRCSRSSRSTS